MGLFEGHAEEFGPWDYQACYNAYALMLLS